MRPNTDSQKDPCRIQDVRIDSYHNQTIEEYVECLTPLYDLKVSQLSPGNFSARSSIIDLGDVVLLNKSTAQKYVCMGYNADALSFTFPLLDTPFYANSVLYNATKQKVSLPGREFRTITPANMEQIIVVIKTNTLDGYLSQQEIELLLDTMKKMEHIQVCKAYKNSATQFIHHIFREIFCGAHNMLTGSSDAAPAENYCKLIIIFLYQYMQYHSDNELIGGNNSHGRIVARGARYIENNPAQLINLDTLSRNVFASRRAVQYAFSELTGLTPLQYIKTNRMNHIRRQLLSADRKASNISDILHDCNITNFGRFSAEYRELFEEGPKDTIARSNAL